MRSTPLEEAVAHATGDSIREIRRRGFGLLNQPDPADFEPYDAAPNIVDWDELDAQRVSLFP